MNTDQKIIKNKIGLLNLAQMLGSVSQACKVMGYSRDSFYRFKEMYDTGGELALQEISRRKPCIKNRVEEHIEKAIVELAVEKPALGQVRVANELARRSMMVSPIAPRIVGNEAFCGDGPKCFNRVGIRQIPVADGRHRRCKERVPIEDHVPSPPNIPDATDR